MSPLEQAVKLPLRKRVQMTSTYIKEVTYVRGCKFNVPAVSLSELKKGIFLRLLWEERVYIFFPTPPNFWNVDQEIAYGIMTSSGFIIWHRVLGEKGHWDGVHLPHLLSGTPRPLHPGRSYPDRLPSLTGLSATCWLISQFRTCIHILVLRS